MQPTHQPNDNNGKTLGAVGFVVQFFWGLPGLLLGIMGLVRSKRAGHKNGLAVAAIILGSLRTLVEMMILFAMITGWLGTIKPPNVTAAEHEIVAVRGVVAASVSVVNGSLPGTKEISAYVSLAEPSRETFSNALPGIARALTNTYNLPLANARITVVDAPAGSNPEQVRQSPVVRSVVRETVDSLGFGDFSSHTVRFSEDELSRLGGSVRSMQDSVDAEQKLAIENAAEKSIDEVEYVRVTKNRDGLSTYIDVEIDRGRNDVSTDELGRVFRAICGAMVDAGGVRVAMFSSSTGKTIDPMPAADGLSFYTTRSVGGVSTLCSEVR